MNGSSFWFWVVVLVVALAIINAVKSSGGRRGRRGVDVGEMRLCRGCANPNPGVARFCRVCGRPLE